MDYFELIAQRESCRNFTEKAVEQEKLVRCIEAARIAPSACNSQPWSFVLVNGGTLAPKTAKCLQSLGMNKFTDRCPTFVVVLEEKATLSAKLGGKVKDQHYAPIDIGIAAAHLCLAATAQGLSSCIMGWFDEKKLKNLLSIPQNKRIRLVVGIGYAADDKLREKKRKPLEQILTFAEE
ncbi:nitroreductase family protein [Candidatus Soleaferrea massiliensis]|uniref:nitroreductase family protein n=1 Tax=Candidatus Soleaferrea massiliensis TaxID=1470354 RepID=UPI0005902AC5|nr:nitroreductase family protein [Candidatus Soleaferrea massiliensis]